MLMQSGKTADDFNLDQFVYFLCGDERRLGIVIGFDHNPIQEKVLKVQWKDTAGIYSTPSLCHPNNVEPVQ